MADGPSEFFREWRGFIRRVNNTNFFNDESLGSFESLDFMNRKKQIPDFDRFRHIPTYIDSTGTAES